MDCVFSRRRFSSKKLTLESLLSQATISNSSSYTSGNNGQYQTSIQFMLLQGSPVYLLSICFGYIGIWKINNRSVQSTPLLKSNNSYGGLTYNQGWYYYYNGGYSTSAQYSSVYGATIAQMIFPSDIDTADIDNLLSTATASRLGYRNSGSTGSVSTSNKANSVYIATKGSGIDFWIPNGTTYTKINGTSTAAASTSGSNLTLGSVYGGSIIGLI